MKKYEITLIFSFLLLLFIQSVSQVNSNSVKLKVNKLGSIQLLNNTNVPNPDEIRIRNEIKAEYANTITIDNIEDEIELVWLNKTTDCNSMFRGMRDIIEIDFSQFDCSEVTDMQYMFTNCISLQYINLNNLNTDNVEDMGYMFYNCRSLTSLNVSNFDTSKVTAMAGMFAYCTSLESLDLSKFNTQSTITFLLMFRNCMNLKYLNLSGMKTNTVVNFAYMFYNCSSLKSLEISHFESRIYFILRFEYMFYNCSSLTSLYIPNLLKTDNSALLFYMQSMFEGCKNLKYLNFKGSSQSEYDNIFNNTPDNMVACFPDDSENRDLRTLFSQKTCEVIDCSDDWETKQKKINGETGDCMDSCSGDFLYEYNTICYRKCPKGTKAIENQYLCEETTIEEEIIYTTNEVLETIELTYENEEEEENNNEMKIIEEEEEEEINQSENNNQEINEKERIKTSDIVTDINTYGNENITNTVENNEEKINKESNNNKENGNYKDIKVAVIAFGVSICVLTIVSTIVIIYFIRKYSKRNNIAPVAPTVFPSISSNIDIKKDIIEEPKENKLKENPVNIYNVHFHPASPEEENSKNPIKLNPIKNKRSLKN